MIPNEYILVERESWIVNHRLGSTYPGYLMVSAKQNSSGLGKLTADALSEIGSLLAELESALIAVYGVDKVLVAKLGFTTGFNCHFHIVPVHAWVLCAISKNPKYTDDPDGNDVLLYVNREHCENQNKEESSVVSLKAISKLAPIFR